MASRTLMSSITKWNVQVNCNLNLTGLTCLTRRCSTAAVQTRHVDRQPEQYSKKQDAYKNARDVPFLLLPHSVRKAYHVHETSLTLPKVFDKYKWLTKTISTPGIPSHHVTSTKNEDVNSELLEGFHDSLLQTVAYQKGYKNNRNPRFMPERIHFSILTNFLRLSMGYSEDTVHLRPENSYLYHKPLLETHWPRNYKFYQTKFRPTFVLRTRNGFEALEEPQVLTPEELERIPGPYDPYAMNVYRQHIVHIQNRPGMDNSRFNPIKHCHTTIMENNKLLHTEQFLSLGMMTMFAQLIAQAQDAGVLHGTELKKPLVSQCIVTNGHRMVFMVYQLNTLHMLDDKGTWNRCWYSPVMEMYERREYSPYYMIYEEAEIGDVLKGFNEEGCIYFANFIRKQTV